MQGNSQSRRYYPILLDITGRPCIVVGGGSVAERKVRTLLESGADVTVVSPTCTEALASFATKGKIRHVGRAFDPADTAGGFLVIAATDDPIVNSAVYQAAEQAGCLVNVADNPQECNFIVPSLVQRGDLLIAVSTSGKSPALAKKLRIEMEKLFGEEYAVLLDIMGELRERVLAKIPDERTRQDIFRRVVDSDALSLIQKGRTDEARRLADEILSACAGS